MFQVHDAEDDDHTRCREDAGHHDAKRKDLREINVAEINMDHSKLRRPRNANRGLYRWLDVSLISVLI